MPPFVESMLSNMEKNGCHFFGMGLNEILVRLNSNQCWCIVLPGLLCLQLRADEAKGSKQLKMTL